MMTSPSKVKLERGKAHIKYMIDGVQVPGYSTIAGELSKPFLVKWANQQGLKGIDTATDRTALDVGSIAHFMIECHINKVEPDLDDYAKNDIKKAENAFLAYLELEKKHDIKYIKTEMPLVSRKYRYGGTCDIYCEIDGKKALVDLKTSKAIYREYYIQIAAYKNLLIENEYPVEAQYIWRIDKEEGIFEDREVILTKEFDLFLKLYEIYRLRKELKI